MVLLYGLMAGVVILFEKNSLIDSGKYEKRFGADIDEASSG
jgi:hypothetical protein